MREQEGANNLVTFSSLLRPQRESESRMQKRDGIFSLPQTSDVYASRGGNLVVGHPFNSPNL